MTLSFWQMFALFGLGFVSAVFALLGVLIGGWLVFRTKREDGELFHAPTRSGDAYVAGSEYDEEMPMGTDASSRFIDAQGFSSDVDKAAERIMGTMNARWQRQQGGVGTQGGEQ